MNKLRTRYQVYVIRSVFFDPTNCSYLLLLRPGDEVRHVSTLGLLEVEGAFAPRVVHALQVLLLLQNLALYCQEVLAWSPPGYAIVRGFHGRESRLLAGASHSAGAGGAGGVGGAGGNASVVAVLALN